VLSGALHLARNLRAGFVLAREGALALVDPSALPPAARLGLRTAACSNGPGAGDEAPGCRRR
jgi:ubiquinone biosynthesis protein